MLVVRLELHGFTGMKVLGTLRITSDGTGDAGAGNYDCELRRGRHVERRFRIEGWPRARGAWGLVRRACEELAQWP